VPAGPVAVSGGISRQSDQTLTLIVVGALLLGQTLCDLIVFGQSHKHALAKVLGFALTCVRHTPAGTPPDVRGHGPNAHLNTAQPAV